MRTWSLHIVGKISRLALSLLHLLATTTVATFKSRTALELENLALRHQLAVLQRSVKRPKLTAANRFLWARLSQFWTGWQCALVIVKPATVIGAGTARVFGCSGPGKFGVGDLADPPFRRRCANGFGR